MLSKIKKITKLDIQQNRYNLEIKDNHNYFANNILVHNCRCLAYRQNNQPVLISRSGKQFKSLPHLVEQLNILLPKNKGYVFDGELYVHGEEFQELIHLIKRDEPHENSHRIEYHIYDMYNINNSKLTFKQRFEELEKFKFINKIKLVKTELLKSIDNLDDNKKWVKENGYEGIMLRNADAIYKLGQRSTDLLKVKEFIDEEFEIVDGYENKGGQQGQCSLICKTKNGTTFNVKPEGTSEQREWYWNNLNNIIGRYLTVRFFSWTTSKNPVPRFPIGVCIRDYE